MSIEEFKDLEMAAQAEAINKYGIFLCQRAIGSNRAYLFAISSFYVELFHDLVNINSSGIRISRVFDDPKYLEPYLEDVGVANENF